MSLEETSPDDWTTQDTQKTPPLEFEGDGVRRCLGCDSKITLQYARVMGDQDDTVHECPHCPPEDSTEGDRADGAAAGLDTDRRGISTRRNP